jgi:hypothetical protein
MSTANQVPETWGLTGDDARKTLERTGRWRLTLGGDWLECGRTPSEPCFSIRRSSTRRPRGLTWVTWLGPQGSGSPTGVTCD